MFSSIYRLFFNNQFLNSLSFLPPIAVLTSISNCLPIASLISAIKGVTVRFNEIGSSILDLRVRILVNIFPTAVFITSGSKTFDSNAFLYFGFSFTSETVSSAIKPFSSVTSFLKSLSNKLLEIAIALTGKYLLI